MKFMTELRTKPAASTESATLSESEIYAELQAFEQVHDAIAAGEDSTNLEVLENLNEIKHMIETKDPTLKIAIINDTELRDMYNACKSMETFAQCIDGNIQACEEGLAADMWWDGPIGALIHRKDATLKHLKPLIPKLIEQVKTADPKKFSQWKMFHQINVFSKYLPDQNQFDKCYKALKDAVAYLISTSPDKFNSDEFNKCFTGSVYSKKNGKVSSSTTLGTGIIYKLDIRKRGWTEQNHFINALEQMKDLVDSMEKLSAKLEANKSQKYDGDAKKVAKQYVSAASNVINLIGHLGRGITSAASKISGSIWKRLFTLEK